MMLLFRWWKIIALALLVAAVALYVGNAERNRGLVKLLDAEVADYALMTERQHQQIASLHHQIERNTANAMKQLAEERRRLILARVEAERIKQQRDTITAELAASRQDWLEAIDHDPTLKEFVAHPVPGAVWHRLRRAAGG